jgi:hypothetical protein
MANMTKDKEEAWEKLVVKVLRNGTLPAIFEFNGKGKRTYSHRNLDRMQTK